MWLYPEFLLTEKHNYSILLNFYRVRAINCNKIRCLCITP